VLLARRSDPQLLDGTWEFPGLDLPPEADPRVPLVDHLQGLWGGKVEVGAELARIRHAITHRRLVVRAFAVHFAGAETMNPAPDTWVWIAGGKLEDRPTSSMTVKLMEALTPLLNRGTLDRAGQIDAGKGRGPRRRGPGS
jgi:adenine-specific DNA glycosylase